MPHAYTEDQFVEQPAIDGTVLETRGWASFTLSSPTESDVREKLFAELRGLPVLERLEHLAWDDTRSLHFYPADLAVCSAEDLQQLDPVTKERLVAKLRERKKGPWHKLAKQLGVEGKP